MDNKCGSWYVCDSNSYCNTGRLQCEPCSQICFYGSSNEEKQFCDKQCPQFVVDTTVNLLSNLTTSESPDTDDEGNQIANIIISTTGILCLLMMAVGLIYMCIKMRQKWCKKGQRKTHLQNFKKKLQTRMSQNGKDIEANKPTKHEENPLCTNNPASETRSIPSTPTGSGEVPDSRWQFKDLPPEHEEVAEKMPSSQPVHRSSIIGKL